MSKQDKFLVIYTIIFISIVDTIIILKEFFFGDNVSNVLIAIVPLTIGGILTHTIKVLIQHSLKNKDEK